MNEGQLLQQMEWTTNSEDYQGAGDGGIVYLAAGITDDDGEEPEGPDVLPGTQ